MDSAATSDGKPIVLFSFGYWGCGSATKELVAAVSSAEAQRGFAPPLWVDIRLQRSVRAAGFRDRAFERLLGANYQWLPSLGNMSVADGGSRIRIQEPAAANDLLDLGVTNPERRVIFFCACATPAQCHRHVVANLVIDAARKRGLDVCVVEWPGGEPSAITLDVPASTLKKLRSGACSLPVPPSMELATATSLAWWTEATLQAPKDRGVWAVGPARFSAGGAHLSVQSVELDPEANDWAEERDAWLESEGYTPRRSDPHRPRGRARKRQAREK